MPDYVGEVHSKVGELAAFLGSPMITNRSDDDLTLLVATLME